MSEWLLPPSVRRQRKGNRVEPLIHGATYFARLKRAVEATGPGDQIFFTDWRGDADERLAPDGPTVADLLCGAAQRGVDVRGLLWRSHSDKTSFSAQENQRVGKAVNDAGGEALLDQRVRRGGSHHQKLVVVRFHDRPEDDVAFVGGIDLCHGRRDDEQHRGDPQQQPMDPRYGERAPWHDVMAEIHGPAVCDVLGSFAERWNDKTPLDHRNPYRRLLQRAAKMPRHPRPLPQAFDPPPDAGPHTVQVLRTYAAKWPPFPFARGGERTIAHAYAHAFSRARQLIYVEDQYLWSRLVAETLAAALRRQPTLRALVVVPRYPDADGRVTGPPNRWGQIEAIRLLRNAGGDRFAVYDIENRDEVPIYVHAKVCIVDDRWMTIGSDNFNRRSWTHDSEITCAVVDETDALPRRTRVQLWSEHLDLCADDSALRDPTIGFELWRERATALDAWHESGRQGPRPSGQARTHAPDPVPRRHIWWTVPAYRLVFDPDGRPLRMRLRGQI